MKSKTIQQGAEAIISLNKNNNVLKHRVKKGYRLPELDNKIRIKRTKSEAKIINKLKNIISVPKIIKTDKENIIMDFVEGKKLSEHFENLNYKQISKKIGEILTKLHNQDIIHGDLTTSNMIYVEDNSINSQKTKATQNKIKNNKEISDKDNKIYLIDFGLGFHSYKVEDKGVDLHLLKQALDAKHYTIADKCFKIILKNYKPKDSRLIIKRISAIEKRGRYKGH